MITNPISIVSFISDVIVTYIMRPNTSWKSNWESNPLEDAKDYIGDNYSCSKNHIKCSGKKSGSKRPPQGSSYKYIRVKKLITYKVTRKLLWVIDLHSKVKHTSSFVLNLWYDLCTGKGVSSETLQSSWDVLVDFWVVATALDLGMTIGEVINETGFTDVLFDSFENYPNLPKNPTVIGL